MRVTKETLYRAVPAATLLLVATLLPTTSGASASAQSYVATAVAQAVQNGQANDPVPTSTRPALTIADGDAVDIGACNAQFILRSKICQFGDPTGSKTVVVFGNSHSNMWIPAIAAAAKAAHWKFFAVVKNACGYDTYSNIDDLWSPGNQCTVWYNWARLQIAKLHPNVIIIGSYTETKYWHQGEAVVLASLKPLAKRVILLSDTPWIPAPANCLLKAGATQGTCLWPEPTLRVAADVQARALARAAGANYLDITPWFCDAGLCPSVINGIIPYKDGAHVTPQYSSFLGQAMTTALALGSTAVQQPTSVPLTGTTTTSSTTAPSTTTTTEVP